MSFSGVWAASVTPLKEDLSIDHDKLAHHLMWLMERGCDGVAVFGSTGEANSFSVEERLEAIDRLSESDVPMNRLVIGAGACALSDAAALSRQAVLRGSAGVLVTPPFYYKHVAERGIMLFFERLIESVRSDQLRIMLYHFPRLVGVGFSEGLVARLVERWPTTVTAIKDSSGDLDRMKRLVADNRSLAVMAGNEKLLLDLLQEGGAGCLTASANLTSRLAAEVFESRDAVAQERLSLCRGAVQAAPFVPGIKHILKDHSGDADWLNIRPPLVALSEEEIQALRAAMPEGDLPNLA